MNIAHSSASIVRESQPRGGRLPSFKSPLCQSPDLETSLEFTTADFYIDESMPSSIDSPPKTTCSTESKSLASDSSKIDHDKVFREKCENEMREYKVKLNKVEETARCLQRMLLEKLPQLVSSTNELKTQQLEMSDLIKSDIDQFKDTSVAVIKNFCSNVEFSHQQMIDKLQSEKDETEMLLKDEIESEQAKCAELRNEVDISKKQMEELKKELDFKVDQLKQEQCDVVEKHDLEIKELIQRHELELEVEIDRMKAELNDKHSELEKELERSVMTVQDKDTAIVNLKKERIKLEETLLGKFQREKEEICDILAKEYDEKLDNAVKLETEKMNYEKSVLKDQLDKMYESDTQKKLEGLKQSLPLEKQEAVEMTKSTLTLEHSNFTEDLRKKILEDKTAEIDKIKKELEMKFQEDLAKFSTEFNEEKQALVDELNRFKLKVSSDCGAQTELNNVNCDTQTGQSLLVDFLSNSSMQTDVIKLLDFSNQTESSYVSNFAIQTDEQHPLSAPLLANSSIQTEVDQTDNANVLHLSTQTDHVSLEQCSTQTDKSAENQSETQTEAETVNHSSIQTDTISQDQTSTQTEKISCDQSSSQTDSLRQQGDSIDGSKSLPTSTAIQTDDSESLLSMQDYEKVRLIAP